MKLITNLRKVGNSINIQYILEDLGRPMVEITRSDESRRFALIKCNEEVDQSYCHIYHQMNAGALVLVSGMYGTVNLMFRINHKRKVPTYYFVVGDVGEIIEFAQQHLCRLGTGFLIGNIAPTTRIHKSLGVMYDIDIQRFNQQLYSLRPCDLIKDAIQIPFGDIEMRIGPSPFRSNHLTTVDPEWRYCLYFENDQVYWIDFSCKLAYLITNTFYRQDEFVRVVKPNHQHLADQFDFTQPDFVEPTPKVIEKPVEKVETPQREVVVEPYQQSESHITIVDLEPGVYPLVRPIEDSPAVELAATNTAVVINGLEPEQKSSIPIVKILIVLTALILLVFAGFTWMGK